MKLKNIILISVISLVSFLASFGAFWFIRSNMQEAQAQEELEMALAQQDQKPMSPAVQDLNEQTSDLFDMSQPPSSLTEEQLRTYIFDIREQMAEQKNRLGMIKSKEQQLQQAQETIDQDVKELENLRVELAAMVSEIKTEQQKLQKNILEISAIEKENLVSIAATYDKMDSESASKIVTNMCKLYSQSNTQNSGLDDAVKIIKYMTDRTKAKLLAELANSEPALASALCKRLKYTVEKG